MAAPDRDTVYTADGTNRTTTTYTRESSATGWFVGIIVALALLAIGYLVFTANSGPTTTVDVNNTPAVETPATDPAITTTPMSETPATPAEGVTPMVETPAVPVETAPVETAPADAAPADAAPVTETPAVPAQ